MSRSTTQRSYLKDLHQLYRMIEASTHGQASIVAANEMSVVVSLHPNSGYNAHAAFTVEIKCSLTFPRDAPEVKFASPIFHPNIDIETGDVCLNILDKWLSCYNLLDVVKSLLFLIDHPNFDSAINPFTHLENMKLLAKKTMRVLAGLPVNGQQFAPNKAWCEWAEAHGCLPAGEEEENDEDGAGNIWEDVTQVVGVEREPETDDEHEAISSVDAFANKVGALFSAFI
ncbi:unnamed protein product [Mesocestoides corti]|uniref:UBC core domain-containing protein n=2 Tax=Mesocestoides corti TaxID=53468 RepID=A0A0R3UCW8_MESCO|nr:unnamed protein product [Mesocestoides corti]